MPIPLNSHHSHDNYAKNGNLHRATDNSYQLKSFISDSGKDSKQSVQKMSRRKYFTNDIAPASHLPSSPITNLSPEEIKGHVWDRRDIISTPEPMFSDSHHYEERMRKKHVSLYKLFISQS